MSSTLLLPIEASISDSPSTFQDVAYGGHAELLCCKSSLQSYFEDDDDSPASAKLVALANECRQSFLQTGIVHIPNFIRQDIVDRMIKEAMVLHEDKGKSFYSTESHTVYQEPQDLANYPKDHPRNALQTSSKYIIDYDRISRSESPLHVLYNSPQLKAFISYVVRPPEAEMDGKKEEEEEEEEEASSSAEQDHELFLSGCPYNSAYYNIYGIDDGLGWHFDRSEFGVNLELQPAQKGGNFELCYGTRQTSTPTTNDDNDGRNKGDNSDPWCFEKVQSILEESTETSCKAAQRVEYPSKVGPGSLIIFAGSHNLHRVTPVQFAPSGGSNGTSNPSSWLTSRFARINAIMTFERYPNQKPNAYSLRKFFGR